MGGRILLDWGPGGLGYILFSIAIFGTYSGVHNQKRNLFLVLHSFANVDSCQEILKLKLFCLTIMFAKVKMNFDWFVW